MRPAARRGTLARVRTANGLLAGVLVAGCAGAPADEPVTLPFTADPGALGGEAYLCVGFDVAVLGGADLGGLALTLPTGPVALHHVSLYAAPTAVPAGATPCTPMPTDAVPLHVWATGGEGLALPPDVALAIPPRTQQLVIQAHALRFGDGAAGAGALVLTPRFDAPIRAGWIPVRAPTPALRPHHREDSTATCTLPAAVTLLSTWPHMHQAGAAFHGALLTGGARTPLVDVVPWQFEAQRAYPLAVVAPAGAQLETHCTWQNDTDVTILPGPAITDEMCGQSLVAYPVEAARCE